MLSELSCTHLHELARLVAKTPPTLVLAIVARRDLEFGLSRMWRALIDQTEWKTMVVRSRREAAGWIDDNTVASGWEAEQDG